MQTRASLRKNPKHLVAFKKALKGDLNLILFLLIVVLVSCGKPSSANQVADVTCTSSAIENIGGFFIPINDNGVFVPNGFTSSQIPDSCNQVHNAILLNASVKIVVQANQINSYSVPQ